jgi:hypothetical protein
VGSLKMVNNDSGGDIENIIDFGSIILLTFRRGRCKIVID